MNKIKFLILVTLLTFCLIFAGCRSNTADVDSTKDTGTKVTMEDKKASDEKAKSPDKADAKNKEKETEDKEITKTEEPATSKKFPDSPAKSALKAHAEGIKSLYTSEFNVVFNEVKFMLEDFSGDGQPELIAVGVHEGNMSYMEVFAYIDGKVSKIHESQIGAANGRNMQLVRYKGIPYVMNESISSSNGFYQQLMQYNGTEWYTVHSSFVEFDFYNNGKKKGCIVDDAPASDEVYDTVRKDVEEGYMKLTEFVSAKEL